MVNRSFPVTCFTQTMVATMGSRGCPSFQIQRGVAVAVFRRRSARFDVAPARTHQKRDLLLRHPRQIGTCGYDFIQPKYLDHFRVDRAAILAEVTMFNPIKSWGTIRQSQEWAILEQAPAEVDTSIFYRICRKKLV